MPGVHSQTRCTATVVWPLVADCTHVDEFMAECPKCGAVKLLSFALELAWPRQRVLQECSRLQERERVALPRISRC